MKSRCEKAKVFEYFFDFQIAFYAEIHQGCRDVARMHGIVNQRAYLCRCHTLWRFVHGRDRNVGLGIAALRPPEEEHHQERPNGSSKMGLLRRNQRACVCWLAGVSTPLVM